MLTTVRTHELVLQVDGTQPLSSEVLQAVTAICDRAEDYGGPGVVALHVSGSPDGRTWIRRPDVSVVSKWERELRRLERLAMPTVAVAWGDCGGTALDALLTTDIRIATPSLRLFVSADGQATWPGMACFRLAHQVGVVRIRKATLFGIPIDAKDALALRIVDEVTEDPEGALAATAEAIASFSGADLAIRRQLIFDAATTSFEDALGAHLAACDRVLRRSSAGATS